MLDDGALADGDPDAVLGLHVWPDLPAGVVGVDDRIAMASKDAFSIAITGRGGHAATPSRGRDAILALAALVQALHAGVARSLDATDRTAFNIGTVTGGRSQSVVAEEASLTGTLRTVDPDVRARLRAAIERITAGVAAAHEVTATLAWADEMPAIVNDPRLVRRTLQVAATVLGAEAARPLPDPPMTADDFALLALHGPAVYFKLGVADPSAASWPPLHSGRFDVDERCLETGASVMTALAADLLAHGL
jgi:amidohydrolase